MNSAEMSAVSTGCRWVLITICWNRLVRVKKNNAISISAARSNTASSIINCSVYTEKSLSVGWIEEMFSFDCTWGVSLTPQVVGLEKIVC